jgi:hypothetical protein
MPRMAVSVKQVAEPASYAARPRVGLNLALGALVGLVVGLGLAFFIEYLDTSVKTMEDVERSRTELLGHALDQLDPSQIEGIATAMAALRVALLASHSDPISGVQHSHQPHREGLTP